MLGNGPRGDDPAESPGARGHLVDDSRLPLASIVTVALNNRAFIEDTIKSVLGQTYPRIEYVIIDGGSTDGTVDVIKSYEDRIAAWISEADYGIADAFNKGLARTSGDYVLFLNSDDWLAGTDVVDTVMREAVRARAPEILYGDCEIVDRASGRRLLRVSRAWSPLAFKFGHMIPHTALFMHRSYFERYGSFDTSFRIAMDFELMLRGIFRCRVVRVPAVITMMRAGGLSMRDRESVVDEIVRALEKNDTIRTRAARIMVRTYFAARRMLRPIKDRIRS